MRTLAYRADLDGLRALAVVAVLLFHARFKGFGGGYVGVDVFFVISGYLITALLHAQWVAGRFSLLEFYERRVRRLFPALAVVLAACALAATWLLLPQDLRYFGGSLVATTLFASNVFFWLEAGYFDTAAEFKPLLHTWSLAVEEQYYVLFPLFLLLALRHWPRRLQAIVLGITLLSLAASEWGTRHAGMASFYLAPFRAWELGLGALLALAPAGTPSSPVLRHVAGVLGLGSIAWSVAGFSRDTPFPGLHALIPCLGTALVIWAGAAGDSVATRILRWRPMVFVGLVSYSLYLWHWPLLVFARHYAVRDLTVPERLTLLLAAFVIAVLSWRYIERPFRGPRGLGTRRQLAVVAGVALASLAAVGLAGVAHDGWPQRYDSVTARLLAGIDDNNPRQQACSFLDATDLLAGRACRLGASPVGAAPSFIVWGDSLADTLMPVFESLASEKDATGLYLGRIGCPPLLGVERLDTGGHCRAYNDAVRRIIDAAPTAPIVLVARWSHLTDEPTYGQEEQVKVVLVDDQSRAIGMRHNDDVLARGLERTLSLLGGRQVFVVRGPPEVGYDVPRSLARIHAFGRDVDIRPTLAQHRSRQAAVSQILADARRRHEFAVLDLANVLCAGGTCRVEQDGRPLYSDAVHLSTFGAAVVADALRPVLEAAPATDHGGERTASRGPGDQPGPAATRLLLSGSSAHR